jgi:hypothetical protein
MHGITNPKKKSAKHLSIGWIFDEVRLENLHWRNSWACILHHPFSKLTWKVSGIWEARLKGNINSRYSGFRHFVITHLNATISICCDIFRRIGMRPSGWWVPFALSFALTDVSYFHLVLQSLTAFYSSKKCLCFAKLNFTCFLSSLLVFHTSLQPNRRSTFKMDSHAS